MFWIACMLVGICVGRRPELRSRKTFSFCSCASRRRARVGQLRLEERAGLVGLRPPLRGVPVDEEAGELRRDVPGHPGVFVVERDPERIDGGARRPERPDGSMGVTATRLVISSNTSSIGRVRRSSG